MFILAPSGKAKAQLETALLQLERLQGVLSRKLLDESAQRGRQGRSAVARAQRTPPRSPPPLPAFQPGSCRGCQDPWARKAARNGRARKGRALRGWSCSVRLGSR